MNEIIADEEDINDEIIRNYFKYHNPPLLAKDLVTATQAKSEQFVNNVNERLIDLTLIWVGGGGNFTPPVYFPLITEKL